MSTTEPAPPRRRGPRRDGDARQDIVDAARPLFAERGFDGTSLRAVARAAGVDPALVHHYFRGKPQLFTATLGLEIDHEAVVVRVLDGPPEAAGHRLVLTLLGVWESPGVIDQLRMVIGSVLTGGHAPAPFRQFLAQAVLGPVLTGLGADQHERRVALVVAQVIGLALGRHVMELEPLAQASHARLAAEVGPSVQRYLLGQLPDVDNDPSMGANSSHDEK